MFTFVTRVKSSFAHCIDLALVTISWDSTIRTTNLWEQRCRLSWSMTRYVTCVLGRMSRRIRKIPAEPAHPFQRMLNGQRSQPVEFLLRAPKCKTSRSRITSLTDGPDEPFFPRSARHGGPEAPADFARPSSVVSKDTNIARSKISSTRSALRTSSCKFAVRRKVLEGRVVISKTDERILGTAAVSLIRKNKQEVFRQLPDISLVQGRGQFGCHQREWQWNDSSCCPSLEYPHGFKKLLQSVATSSLLCLPPVILFILVLWLSLRRSLSAMRSASGTGLREPSTYGKFARRRPQCTPSGRNLGPRDVCILGHD